MKKRIYAPCDGRVIPLSEVNDQVFSQGILGKGFGIIPSEGEICSPVEGVVTSTHETGHAYVISTGEEAVLVHVGIDTVELTEGVFTPCVSVNDRVEIGRKLVIADLDKIKEKGYDPVTIVTVSAEGAKEIKDIKVKYGKTGSKTETAVYRTR